MEGKERERMGGGREQVSETEIIVKSISISSPQAKQHTCLVLVNVLPHSAHTVGG